MKIDVMLGKMAEDSKGRILSKSIHLKKRGLQPYARFHLSDEPAYDCTVAASARNKRPCVNRALSGDLPSVHTVQLAAILSSTVTDQQNTAIVEDVSTEQEVCKIVTAMKRIYEKG
jgi:uncharacterized protein